MYKEKTTKGFGDIAITNKGKSEFLIKVKDLIEWEKLNKILQSKLKRNKNAAGNPPYSELLLFKILLLETWFNLSDEKVEEAINDRISFIKFLELSLESSTPDHSTISRFRNSLIKSDLDKELFCEINRQLETKGILVKSGIIVDATIVSSSRRPKKIIEIAEEDRKESDTEASEEKQESHKVVYSKDVDAGWIKKRNQYYYGHKVHNAVTPTGFIVGGILTPANKSDINNFENVMNELPVLNENIPVLADKGYASAINREYLLKRTLSDKIMHKAVKGKPLTEEQKEENREISKYRYVVEQTFGLLKLHFGFDRMRYIGNRKCNLEYRIKSMAFNLKKACYSF